MRPYIQFVLGVIMLLATPIIAISHAQVRIEIPLNTITNGTEFSIDRVVLNTGSYNEWRQHVNPTMTSLNSNFTHTTVSGNTLPLTVLQWQLQTIGGASPLNHQHDVIPGFQSFSTTATDWYRPHNKNSNYTPGNVVFKFKIPAGAFTNNTVIPGEYDITITHNYASGGGVTFTPASFQVIIVIPYTNPIQWVSNNTSVYHEVSTLNSYRTTGDEVIPIGLTEISNSVPFNFWAKTTSSSIQFTSSKGVVATRSPSFIKLGSPHPKIVTSPLSVNWRNYSPNTPFIVEAGNRNTFDLNLSISNTDFKNHFFEAGTYRFQIQFDARSVNNLHTEKQNTDVTLVVRPLSEISMELSRIEVNFEFNTAAHYQNGQTKIIPNQLRLSNNETYELYVKSDAAFFRKSGIQSDVPSSILQVGVEGGSQGISLSTIPQKIIDNGTPILNKNLDLKYNIPPTAAQSLVAKEKTTYSINVIYSFTAI